MPNATALITCVTPGLTEQQRRDAEWAFARELPGYEAPDEGPRRLAHGTVFRAKESALRELAADGRVAVTFLLRVYGDSEGASVRIGTRVTGPPSKAKGDGGDQADQVQGEQPDAAADPGYALREGEAPNASLGPASDLLYIQPGEKWADWIVQLWVPPHPAAVASLLDQGVQVVGLVDRLALHVRTVEPVADLSLVGEDIRWIEPYHPVLRIQPELLDPGVTGRIIDYATIHVDPPQALASVRTALAELGADLGANVRTPALTDGPTRTIVARLPADVVPAVARVPGVAWIQYAARTPKAESEREAQVVAGNVLRSAPLGPAVGEVQSGYRRWLNRMDLSGAGATIAICDTGVAWNQGNARRSAPDLDRRQVAAFDYTNGEVGSDTWGHGTHLAGLAVGSGIRDSSRVGAPLSLGLGVAPGASYVTQNAIAEPTDPNRCPWWPATSLLPYTRDASRAGATILTMAWTTDGWFVGQGYVPLAAELDGLVRDPADTGAPGGELVVVASAGNVPNAGAKTITPPKEAKNIVVVGASTRAPDVGSGEGAPGPDGIATFSSRGPALDGRILPTVVAPGVDVISTLSRTAGDPALRATAMDRQGLAALAPEDADDADYALLNGTSTSVGLVAGACALLDEWWRSWGDTGPPRADLTRALLVIGADDLSVRLDPEAKLDCVRPGPIPDSAQGWGRVNVGNVVCQADARLDGELAERLRGPKRVERGELPLGAPPHIRRYARARAGLPIRATLAWTDAPGSPGKNPALCNDLDLTVRTPDGGHTWSGNHFAGGWSAPGRVPAPVDNLECVFLRESPDVLDVIVEPVAITADARPPYSLHTPWQDYALVLENLVPVRGDTRAVALLDRSARMGTTGALAALGQAWQGLARGLRRGDALGLVRFDDDARVVIPAHASDPIPPFLAPGDANGYCAAVAGTASGAESRLHAGLHAARAVEKAPLVLLSDGAFPDAAKALTHWGGRGPIHAVGLWPVAAETTLRSVARRTGGRYLFGPTEALLGAAMAELRAELTDDAVVRSDVVTVGGPQPRATLAIPVEDGADGLLVAITWGDAKVRGVQGRPTSDSTLGVALRTPDGHLLPPSSSVTLVTRGPGSVHLEIGRLRPGRWVVELELDRAAPLAVHVAASVPPTVPGGPRLRTRFWPPAPRTGEALTVIARWVGVPGLVPDDANVSGVVERPFAKAALNVAHRRRITSGPPVPAALGGRELRARAEILAAEGVDIFAPLTEALDFRWVPDAADGQGPGWQAVIPIADLPYTWSAQVSGWAIAKGHRRFVRAARASTVVRGPPLEPRIVEPEAPSGDVTRGPWFRPGEEVDIEASGYTPRWVWYDVGEPERRAATGGAAHYRLTEPDNAASIIGHLACIGGGGSFFPLVIPDLAAGKNVVAVAATGSSTQRGDAYAVGKDTWRWQGGKEWPESFDLLPGDWVLPPASSTAYSTTARPLKAFPETGEVRLPKPLQGVRVYRVQLVSGATVTTIGFVVWSGQLLTWYADPQALTAKEINGVKGRALAGPADRWRFRSATPTAAEYDRTWVRLDT